MNTIDGEVVVIMNDYNIEKVVSMMVHNSHDAAYYHLINSGYIRSKNGDGELCQYTFEHRNNHAMVASILKIKIGVEFYFDIDNFDITDIEAIACQWNENIKIGRL